MSPPLVSVILPAYNHARYVEEALDSIAAQDYPNMELVAINDGSTDKTQDVIEKWINEHSSTLAINYRSRENKGISATLNELLSMARGRFIAGAASDDLLLKGSISTRVDYLLKHPNHMAVFGDYTVIDDEGELIHQRGLIELHNGNTALLADPEGLKQEMLRNFSVAGPVLMFDRDIFTTIGNYDETLKIEDWDIYLRMSGLELLGFINQPLAAYRWHGNNASANIQKSKETRLYERKILEKNRAYFSGSSRKLLNQLVRRRRRKEFDYNVRTLFKRLTLQPVK